MKKSNNSKYSGKGREKRQADAMPAFYANFNPNGENVVITNDGGKSAAVSPAAASNGAIVGNLMSTLIPPAMNKPVVYIILAAILTLAGYKVFGANTSRADTEQTTVGYEMTVNKSLLWRADACYVDGKPVYYERLPNAVPYLLEMAHCEHIYDLGDFDYVSICDYLDQPVLVFKEQPINNSLSGRQDITLDLTQFCSLLYLAPYLLEDTNAVLARNKRD